MRRWFLALALAGIGAAASPATMTIYGGDAGACVAGTGPAILAHIVGLKDREGQLKLELYPANDEDFLKDDRDLVAQGKVFHRIRIPTPAAGAVAMCIRAPKPGRYALLFTHNRDSKNKFSIWVDGAGTPNNARMGRAKPKLASAIIDVGPGVSVAHIQAQYLRGFSGFAPLAD